jgi:hypothetical protein
MRDLLSGCPGCLKMENVGVSAEILAEIQHPVERIAGFIPTNVK